MFPDGYRDPVWDGSVAGFRTVAEARAEAVCEGLSAGLPDGLSFEFTAPGAATWAELETLCLKWRQQKVPNRLRCHPLVVSALRASVPSADWPTFTGPSLVYLDVVVDEAMAAGGWELLAGDEVIESGVVGGEG